MVAVEVMVVTDEPGVSGTEKWSIGGDGVRSVWLRSHGSLVIILADMVVWTIVIKDSEGNLTAGTVGARGGFGR
jgi:hypothetical protein